MFAPGFLQGIYATSNPTGKPKSSDVTPINDFAMKEKITFDDIQLTLQNELARGSVIELKDVVSWFKINRILRTKLPSLLLDFSMA